MFHIETERTVISLTATIKDIAQKSGFSTSTVSRALNNDPHILVATRKKNYSSSQTVGL